VIDNTDHAARADIQADVIKNTVLAVKLGDAMKC
jgi:hypothetical protein